MRKAILSQQEKIENKKKSNSGVITLRVDSILNEKIDKFSKQYQSRNKAVIDLITTHPDFLKMFPKKDKIKITMEQLIKSSN